MSLASRRPCSSRVWLFRRRFDPNVDPNAPRIAGHVCPFGGSWWRNAATAKDRSGGAQTDGTRDATLMRRGGGGAGPGRGGVGARRGNGEGSIRRRTDGRYEGRYTDASGQQRSVYGKRRKETAK